MKNALILLAGGLGKRMGSKTPKQFLKIGNTNCLDYFLRNLDNDIFDIILIASKKKDQNEFIKPLIKKFINHNIQFCLSGKTRQESANKSLIFLKKFNPKKVLIHDSARPLVSNEIIKKIIETLNLNLSCIPYIVHNDLIKTKKNIYLDNKNIFNIQTPQGFKFKTIYLAHQETKIKNAKDDSFLLEQRGVKLKMINGEKTNIKITEKKDLDFFKICRNSYFKSGIGYDIHKIDFNSKKKLTLCGVKIDHPPLIGHSDADAGYHAVCDSILGSLSMNDIGYYFNNKNPKWKNKNSKIFIKFCHDELIKQGFIILNLDINFICESPNIKKISPLMKKNLSNLLNISTKIISIKATTNEKISFIGRGEGIAAESIVQIKNV